MKKCAKCKKEYSLSMFNKHKRSSDGYGSYCISCTSEYARQYRERNRVRLNKHAKRWREDNPERMAELYREYEKSNRLLKEHSEYDPHLIGAGCKG